MFLCDAVATPMPNEVGITLDEAYVNDLDSIWSYGSLYYFRLTELGKYGLRLNAANRFDETALQYQLETYPKLNQNIYATFIVSYANHSQIHYPTFHLHAEPYFNFYNHFELSLGYDTKHYNQFSGQKIDYYTASLGKYIDQYYLWARISYFNPISDELIEIGARKYFNNEKNYIGLRANTGKIPDIADVPPLDEILLVNQTGIGIDSQYAVHANLFIKAAIRYLSQHYIKPDQNRDIVATTIGVVWTY